MGLGRKAEKWDQLDPDLKSFAHMAAVAMVGCSFCLDFAYFQAHNGDSTRPRPARCPGGASRPVFTRWSVTSWSTPRR